MRSILNILTGALLLTGAFLASGCSHRAERASSMEYASWFDIKDSSTVILYSPYGGTDTISGPLGRIACMSTSYVGFLAELGAVSSVCAVSGVHFAGSEGLHAVEAGYESSLDYEAILNQKPDILLTYSVSSIEPQYISKLRELGIRTAILSEHLESHPLGRAEYIKLFGVLTGRRHEADSVFRAVRDRYNGLVATGECVPVLINIPYADSWYIPGGNNYMARLVGDAGGILLGSEPGRTDSSIISVEKAYSLSQRARFWLNPGWCGSLKDLTGSNPLFEDFLHEGLQVWNNTLQTTPGGGNMFWESGPARPDLILEDLVSIFSGTARGENMHYYKQCR